MLKLVSSFADPKEAFSLAHVHKTEPSLAFFPALTAHYFAAEVNKVRLEQILNREGKVDLNGGRRVTEAVPDDRRVVKRDSYWHDCIVNHRSSSRAGSSPTDGSLNLNFLSVENF